MRLSSQAMVSLFVLIAVQLAMPAAPALAADNADVIERMYMRRTSPHDPGTIVALLHNDQNEPVKVRQVEVNGHKLSAWPKPTNPVAWQRLTRQTLEPGQSGVLQAKLVQRIHGAIRVNMTVGGEDLTSLVNASAADPVHVTAVRFGPEGERINVFVRNNGSKPETLKRVRLDHTPVWGVDQGPLAIQPGKTNVVRLSLEEPLEAAERILLRLELKDRSLAVTDRAIPGFRLSIESGNPKMAKRIAADPLVLESFQFEQQKGADGEREAAGSLVQRQGSNWSMVSVSHGDHTSKQNSDLACVFACPTHATDSYQTSAYLGMKAQRQIEKKGRYQSFIHACRTQPLRGIAVFGPIADAIRFNAQIKTGLGTEHKHRDKAPWTVHQLTHYAVETAAPSAALPMIPLERDRAMFPNHAPLATETRQMVYSAMAAGAGGIAYRVMPEDWRDEKRDRMLNEVKKVNHEIRQVRDLLATGFPRSLVNCSKPKVQVACIDAAPKGLVVLAINHDVTRSAPGMPPSVTAQTKNDVMIDLQTPEGLQVGKVSVIEGKTQKPFDGLKQNGDGATLNLKRLGATKMLLVRLEQVSE